LVKDDEPRLISRITELARQYGRYGYRRITALLNREGWRVEKGDVSLCPNPLSGKKLQHGVFQIARREKRKMTWCNILAGKWFEQSEKSPSRQLPGANVDGMKIAPIFNSPSFRYTIVSSWPFLLSLGSFLSKRLDQLYRLLTPPASLTRQKKLSTR